jgi:hypothetical protein
MTMSASDPHPDSLPDEAPDSNPDNPAAERADPRSDLEQAVEARADAVARGEGGPEPSGMTDTGEYDGTAGSGGVVKNQDLDAQ